jgi:hypothetical protein
MASNRLRFAPIGALAVLAVFAPDTVSADEVYLCDGAVSHVTIPTGAPANVALGDPCVRSHHVMRKHEAIRKLAQATPHYGEPQGVSSRDFCFRDEPCHKPLPRWIRRWNYDDPPARSVYFRHIFER